MDESLLRVGVITTTHGIKGEVKIHPTTQDLHRFDYLKEAVIVFKTKEILVHIESVKYFKGQAILKFEEFDKIEDVEGFRGCDLFVTRENAIPLEEGEFYIADLIGLDVFSDEDVKLGSLTDVLETGANDVFVVKMDNGKELLIPDIDDCILDIDLTAGVIKVHLLEGLLDL